MEHSQKYYDYLKDRIEYYCDSDKRYSIYWDYRDNLSPNELRDVYKNSYKEGYRSAYDYLENELYDRNFEWENYFLNSIRYDADKSKDQDLIGELAKIDDAELMEDLVYVGYNGLDVNLKDLLKNTSIKVNILFATPNEAKAEMTNICGSFGDSFYWYDLENVDDFDNALTYLIHQQGHTIEEYYKSRKENPDGFPTASVSFIDSVTNEIVNTPSYSMSALSALIELDGEDILTFFDKLHDEKEYLQFSPDTEIGLFNPWQGAGGLLEINLEMPFVVPVSMVFDFQMEGETLKFQYSVDQAYGLVGSVWKNTLSYTMEPPQLVQEDLSKLAAAEEQVKDIDSKDDYDLAM